MTAARATSRFQRKDDDWYVEPAWTIARLIDVERPFIGSVMDPCCGCGTIPTVLMQAPHMSAHVIATDIRDRGASTSGIAPYTESLPRWQPNSVICNPPYSMATHFIETALAHTKDRVCALLRLDFIGSLQRVEWFGRVPLARIYVLAPRVSMRPNNVKLKGSGSTEFAWFVFEHHYVGPKQILHLLRDAAPCEPISKHPTEADHA